MTAQKFEESSPKKQKEYRQAYATPIGLIFGFYVSCFFYFFFPKYHPFIPLDKIQKRQLVFSSFVMLIVSGLHFYLFYRIGGLWFYLNYHGLAIAVGGLIAVGIPLLQHSHEEAVYFDEATWSPLRAQILGTYNYRMPYWLERVFNDVNLHIVHHINPKVPWYNLRTCYYGLQARFPDYVFEYDLNWSALKKIYQNPVVEWDPEFNFYKSAPFRK